MSSAREISRFTSLTLLLLPATLAPMPYGSVGNNVVTAWTACMALSLLFAGLERVTSAQWWVVIAVATWLVLGGVLVWWQMLPDPPLGAPDKLWIKSEALLGSISGARLSASVNMPFRSFGPPLLLALTFIRSVLLGADRRGVALLLRCIAFASLVFALLGLLQLALAPESILLRRRTAYFGSLTGPFINRNTAATYFGSCALLWSCIFRARIQRNVNRSRSALRSETVVAGGAASLNVFCVLLTRSRGGLLLTLLALLTLFLRTPRHRRQSMPRRRSLVQIVIATGGLLAVMQILGSAVASRIQQHGLVDANRWLAYRSAWRLAQAHPWFGIGWGEFEAVFPSVRLPELGYSGVWDRAHSTLLELLVETGFPFTILTFLLWAGCAIPLLYYARQKHGSFGSGATHAALLVSMIGIAHSSFDFSLQIPGYAVVFGSIVGAGIGIACSSSSTHIT